MDTFEAFTQHRPLLFAIAYRMLGSAMDAEDIVQDAYLRWQRAPQAEVLNPKAYLTTIVTRLSLDQLRSARVTRETYLGPWLPEPVLAGDGDALAESLSLAFLTLLEALAPVERAAFLLREVFDFEYDEIARLTETSEANCRQMVSRARERLRAGRPRFSPSPQEHERLVLQFAQACATGDLQGLLKLFADDITVWSDGGGKVSAARRPIYGPDRAARFILGILAKTPDGLTPRLAVVNGRAAIVSYVHGQPYNVLWLDVADGQIRGLYNVLNPDKLRALPPLDN